MIIGDNCDGDDLPRPPPSKQPRIDQAIDDAAKQAYMKLMKTAYQLAVNTMPFNDFKVLVKVQKENGVQLIEGKQNEKIAKDLIYCLAEVIKEKLAVILTTKKVFSTLSDGSQARKTGADKELIFVRVERGGVPTYYCIGMEDLASYGGANANGVKGAHDQVFKNMNVHQSIYTNGMVSCTADGASVNFGRWEGFLVKMEETRPWLVKLHCVNHRAELAVKSVFESSSPCKEIDILYEGIRNLLKNSGRLKSELRSACDSLNITYYSLQKLHGTRFQHQRRRGFQRFIHMWIPLAVTFENALAQPSKNYTADTRAKLSGYLKKLRRYDLMCVLSTYYDVLNVVGVLALVFEKKDIYVTDVEPARDKTIGKLEEYLEKEVNEDNTSEYFKLEADGHGNYTVSKIYALQGHERKKKDENIEKKNCLSYKCFSY